MKHLMKQTQTQTWPTLSSTGSSQNSGRHFAHSTRRRSCCFMDSQTSDGRAIFFEMTSLMGGVRAENCTENQNSELTVAEERNDALDRQYETVMHHTMFNKSERFERNFRLCGLKIFSVALRWKPRVKQPLMENIPRSFCASLLNYAISSFCVLVCVVMWKPGCYYTHKKKELMHFN